MRQNILSFIFTVALLVGGVNEASSQERPKLREINDKKYQHALQGVVPAQKKEECGYADSEGKFVIPAIFHKVMPMSDRHVGFVCFLDEFGFEYWTPISLKGLYLTDLNFSKVVKDFDERGLAVVRRGEMYGIINHTGKMVAACSYKHFEDKGLVYLLYNKNGGCVAVAKDKSEKGYTSYSFAANEPIIVKTESGYGIISPRNYYLVADFLYESVKELITWDAYILQKGAKKYLYAADKMSMAYDEVILGHGQEYFSVKRDGKWGVVTRGNEVLLSCSQDEIPMLRKNEYACFYENGSPVYLTVNKRASASEYDDYIYNVKHKGAPAEYLLDETLAFDSKKKVNESVAACYGTKNFDLIKHLDAANQYAESRKFILLSRDNKNATFFDVATGDLREAGAVLYHAFPSKTGAPAYASTLRDGQFGIMDIRNSQMHLPAEYDRIIPVNDEYAVLQKSDSLYLYHVNDNIRITTSGCESMDDSLLAWDILIMKQNGKDRFYNIADHKWTLPDDHSYVHLVQLPSKGEMTYELGALMKKGTKGAVFDVKTGERLTEYLFDDVVEQIFAEKYQVVTLAGKKGLYDVQAKKYLVPCEYSEIANLDEFKEEEYAIVTKAGKQGVYNLTKNKLVVTAQNDEVDIKDGFVRIRRGGMYAVFSLEYNKMMFDSPVDEVVLMEDGYALLNGPDMTEKGVYNLNWNEWYIDPMPGHDMCFLGGDYVGVAGIGVGNYKTNKVVFRIEGVDVDAFIGVKEYGGEYIVMGDPIEGASMWMYKLDDPNYYLFASNIEFFNPNGRAYYPMAIVEDYEYDESWAIAKVNSCKLMYLPYEECDRPGEAIIKDSYDGVKFTGMEQVYCGLIKVSMENGEEWLFDLVEEKWLLKSKGKIEFTKLTGPYSDGREDYMQIKLPNGQVYLYDYDSLYMVELTDTFKPLDYRNAAEMLWYRKYCTEFDGAKWKLIQDSNKKPIVTGCDRISLMYKE